ncbi:winged helix-turn-helix transcriptional regulator [Pseudomonas sp. S75]|uniref:MarR family winged helix-turn-helix transcriptional regulator n=1 Tax=unclassified Pseudomonas TaxID=196821 RepID=UPI001903293A|nr:MULTISPECIES: MarR family winged helix-turn-helix transcriptional regulator [unclassified Pseudomonas]MBJ9973997.1 winged helix-turn-helix transcriptional regulator [Pseudomonas sp. S30]MBK0152073.1 winged helix-turn-helix transcriptional regulator [Pseudomonas sp. S75]
MKDHVDFVVAQWAQAMPAVDATSMEVFGRMARLQKHLERRRGAVLDQYGFKEGEFDVMATLRRAGAPYQLTPTELYNSLLITSGAMTNRLNRLKEAGMIEQIHDTADKRSYKVALTAEGLRSIELAVGSHTDLQNHFLAPLAPGEREALARMLKAMLAALPEDGEPIP